MFPAGFLRRPSLPRLSHTLSITALTAGLLTAAEPVSFNRDIRPIMADTCFRCHGPDKGSRMANLRLDLRDAALQKTRSGITPIVPGKPDESAIIQRIFASNARVMPPKSAHKELSAAQKDTIRRWVAEGAVYQGHWAYEPVKRPAVPTPAAFPNAPVRNPVDAFIQARLAKEDLTPSAEADRPTLIRRVTLDLTGLPPTADEVDQFVQDKTPNAYEKLVDRLLASPRFAEKQAMHWLDAVRYADTAGFHGDNPYPAWPYRDYVLKAFNTNKPFDEFTREQLAGDLIPHATREQKVASAYNRLLRVSAEGGIQPKEYLAKYGADRVRTVSNVWLGATMGCAECHDHKFDPITAKDFYSMKAFFADLNETGLVPDKGPKAWGAKLPLPSADQQEKLNQLTQTINDLQKELDQQTDAAAAKQAAWEQQIRQEHQAGQLAWQYQRPISARSAHGAKLTIYNDELLDSTFFMVGGKTGSTLGSERKPGLGTVVASGPNPDREVYTVTVRPGEGQWAALGVEVFQDESLLGVRLARGSDRFLLSEVEAEVSVDGTQPGKRIPLTFAIGDGTYQPPEHSALAAIDNNPHTGWGVNNGEGNNPFLALRFQQPVRTTAQSVVTIRLRQESDYRKATIGRFRVLLSAKPYSWPESGNSAWKHDAKPADAGTLTFAVERGLPRRVQEALAIPAGQRTEAQAKAVREHFQWCQPELQPLLKQIAEREYERGLLDADVPRVMVAEATEPRETRLLPRGDWMNDTGEVLQPAVPAFLGKAETGDRRATRLDLANWIVSKDNPLTARVFTNRMWRQFFGIGISKVLDDFGSQGEWPTHPELLDWLAAEFMEPTWQAEGAHAWDVKHTIRTIVLSHAYRQSSHGTPALDERDPDNRLLARQSRFRVDAEVVHDIALSVAGLLQERFGGPSVKPYQPEGYYTAMNFPKREYSASYGADLYRRGLYTHWQRTFLHPTLMTFDAPSREECTINRVNSNTPLQALVLLNDPIYLEAARVFAQRTLENGGRTWDARLDWAFRNALGRTPTAAERTILNGLYRQSLSRFQKSPEAAKQFLSVGEAPRPVQIKPAELAATATVTRAILNLHETITRN